jgi:hypothetical protein
MAKKKKPVPTWKPEPFGDRVQRCRAMLYIHGLLSDAENRKVVQRIGKAERTKESEG